MANQQALNQLLQWSIQNSDASIDDPTTTQPANQEQNPHNGLNQEMLAQLLGGPSDADLMRQSMEVIKNPDPSIDAETKMQAWDNFEQLIENLDNANNIQALKLWEPLVSMLDAPEGDERMMAAWCCSTAVQNNVKSQECMLATGAVLKLVKLAVEDDVQAVRKKAVSALSSEVRNFQPALDELEKSMPENLWSNRKTRLDAAEMEDCDEIINLLRSQATRA